MEDKKVVVVFSGGMDSTVALYQAVRYAGADNVSALTFNYQSKHNDVEYACAVKTCERLGVRHDRIDLSNVSEHLESDLLKSGGDIPEGHYAQSNMRQTVVPFRNGIMLSIACGIAESRGANTVVLGNHAGDHSVYPDCRGEFISAMSSAMKAGTYLGVTIFSPFCLHTKTDIASMGDILEVNWNETYSCYKGGDTHCGVCSTCFERREAFVDSSVEDPTNYLDKRAYAEIKRDYDAALALENEK